MLLLIDVIELPATLAWIDPDDEDVLEVEDRPELMIASGLYSTEGY